jgi:uncharacterized protein YceK
MKKQMPKIARIFLCLMVLVAVYGCSTFQKRPSTKSWSQTAAKEEREQERNASQDDDWSVIP